MDQDYCQSFYSPPQVNDTTLCDYGSPDSVSSVLTLGSEGVGGHTPCTDPPLGNTLPQNNIPEFQELLEENTDSNPHQVEQGASLNPDFLSQFAMIDGSMSSSLHGIINSRELGNPLLLTSQGDDLKAPYTLSVTVPSCSAPCAAPPYGALCVAPSAATSSAGEGTSYMHNAPVYTDLQNGQCHVDQAIYEDLLEIIQEDDVATVPQDAAVTEPAKKDVKEEIRCRLRGAKRKYSELQEENHIKDDAKPDIMSDADNLRKERRKLSNRKAARKCREKKLKEHNDLVQAKENSLSRLSHLESENVKLQKENGQLRQQMQQMMLRCTCFHSKLDPS